MQMCLRRLTFQNQRSLIDSEGVRSNLAQSLLLIKISQSHCLSETRPWNSICVHICSYQTLHLCWIYSLPVGVRFMLVDVLIFTGVGIFGCCAGVCGRWENEFETPSGGSCDASPLFLWHLKHCLWNCVRIINGLLSVIFGKAGANEWENWEIHGYINDWDVWML